uniref:SFRICE_028209 n=1 Tax=Spodoptera frugiperda TaxID=7108 RepID=A0A2H1WC03_SPOFR
MMMMMKGFAFLPGTEPRAPCSSSDCSVSYRGSSSKRAG